jgi:hypothetical protein
MILSKDPNLPHPRGSIAESREEFQAKTIEGVRGTNL